MKSKALSYYTSASIFIFFTLALIMHSGYSYGSAMLLLVSLPFLFKKNTYQNINYESRLIIYSLLFFFAVWVFEIVFHQVSSRGLDKPSRYLAGAFILLYLLKHPPKQEVVWSSVALGGVITGVFAIWFKLSTGVARVDGYNNSIQYGNISMLMGLISLSGLVWAWHKERFKALWLGLLLLGFILGVTASLLSGGRGGWIGTPLALLYIIAHYRKTISTKVTIGLVMGLTVFLAAAYSIDETGVQNRIEQAIHDVELYQQGKTKTSVGTRFELWRGSLILFAERPIFGWGESGYEKKMHQLKADGIITPAFIGHSHNEILYISARIGLLGLASLLALYLVPIWVFRKLNRQASLQQTSLALAGIIFGLCHIDFGLTQAFMAHNSGILFFIIPLVVLFSCLNNELATTKNNYDQ